MKTITMTITEEGDAVFLKNDATDIFLEMGQANTRRASHVEPEAYLLRAAFHGLRSVFGEYGWVSDFTRHWPCLWRVNTAPVGGPILEGRWRNRQQAIEAEIEFLNEFFVQR